MWFHPISKELLFSKKDKEDPRLGETVQIQNHFDNLEEFSPADADFHLQGYSDDEGIALNGGRTGAQTGPRQIRTFLFKMTPALGFRQMPRLSDIGDISINVPLEQRHERARAVVRTLVQQNKKFISFGGGHDYGYSDACGFLDQHKENAVVINFDAHLDVRPSDKGFHSGTPFFRMLGEFSGQVDFFEVGLQPQCNSQKHLDWAKTKGAKIFLMQDLQEGLLPTLQKALRGLEKKKLFLSVDIDAFASMEAPGCSQSWTTGFQSRDFMPALEWLIQTFDTVGMGIYEVSPPLDFDNHTSKLAALIAHRFIFKSLTKTQVSS